MRLPERYKQLIYIQNETYPASGDWLEPFTLRGLVTPINDTIAIGGINVQGNTDDVKFESSLNGVELINQNSRIWINRKPDDSVDNTNFTHKVLGRSNTTNGMFITIHCDSASVNNPVL